MLATPATYPASGSFAYLKPNGETVRILQRRADGRLLISKTGPATSGDLARRASTELTVAADDLAEHHTDAVAPPRPRRRSSAK